MAMKNSVCESEEFVMLIVSLVAAGNASGSYSYCDGSHRYTSVSKPTLHYIHLVLYFSVCSRPYGHNFFGSFPWLLVVWLILIAIGLQKIWHISALRSRGSSGTTKLYETGFPSAWEAPWRGPNLWGFFTCILGWQCKIWYSWSSVGARRGPLPIAIIRFLSKVFFTHNTTRDPYLMRLSKI